MGNNELKTFIENARISKGYSQRELSKLIGLSQSTYNDTINGKIKKVDIDILRKISEGLDLSLNEVLKKAGYEDVLFLLNSDKYKYSSTKVLKNLLEEYKKSQLDLLDFDSTKRKTTRKARKDLFTINEHLKIMKNTKDSLYTIDKAIDDIQEVFNELEMVENKYDYDRLPKDM